MASTIIRLENISKSFDDTRVLSGFSLDIQEGEFVTLLGSSGCGKTTTLRIIAGLEDIQEGRVFLDGTDVTDLPPEKRNVNTIFQNYALFPHMNVYDNIAYGLKVRKVDRETIRREVTDMLEKVQLQGMEKRRISQLSGGQKQRVAIARALVNRPKVLLLDEPLSALDANLRKEMQGELKKLQRDCGITFIYITHDQEEALNLSNRIVLMNNGRIEQTGTPDEIYNRPKTTYAARFIGNANIIRGTVESMDRDEIVIGLYGRRLVKKNENYDVHEGDTVSVAVRSENIHIDTGCRNGIKAELETKTFRDGVLRLGFVMDDGTRITATTYGITSDLEIGQNVCFCFRGEDACLLDL